jgi:catechol 2,3-dioxygenase-like lactoylglutathione lyase family enzyme
MRDQVSRVRPRRLSHALFFTPDIDATIQFYCDVLGLRVSDHPGPVVFLHGVHGSDHHLIAFAQSGAAGYHHSAWEVGSIEEVGLGAFQMSQAGYTRGWGVGRHVLGSNYFHYVRDPWGSFAEYSFDIDFIPADVDWEAGRPSPENSFFLWGPLPPEDFVANE